MFTCVHNGIVVNDDELWNDFPQLNRTLDVDSEIVVALIAHFNTLGEEPISSIQRTFSLLRGAATIAVVGEKRSPLLLATNTGSLYHCFNSISKIGVFASEKSIIASVIRSLPLRPFFEGQDALQIKPGMGISLDLSGFSATSFILPPQPVSEKGKTASGNGAGSYPQAGGAKGRVRSSPPVKRCSACILPHTIPFIDFDGQGVCNFCRKHQPLPRKGLDALEELVAPYRKRDGSSECLVGFSGGRDSSYGLYFLKEVMGMNPVAFTYDWGMVTDLARRNQARICGISGIEHIIISANIDEKRGHIRKNVEAWLRKPELGVVPLFMAGDKHFYRLARQLMRKTGFELLIYCENRLEKTGFKSGFSGIMEGNVRTYNIGLLMKVRLALFYAGAFARNPAYINASLWDSFTGFLSSYWTSHQSLYLYDYVPWDEAEIDRTLVGRYGWEMAPDSVTSWRIGDGSAPFYNFIYYTICGFSENDTFRSNQIREGLISRQEALRRVEEENQPRWDSIREYADLINVRYDKVVKVVEAIPKMY